MSDHLLKRLDEAAIKLLDELFPDKPQDGAPAEAVAASPTFVERVKAFESVIRWASQRKELVAATPGESKFERLRGEFHGRAAQRGNGQGKTKALPSTAGPNGIEADTGSGSPPAD
jgi:hypothetical protein